MRIGLTDQETRSVGPALANMRASESAGLDCAWIAGGWRDPMTLCAIGAREVPRISVGTAIVSIWETVPVALAEQALTIHDAVGGRFTLGLGLSHPHQVEQRAGMKLERPIRVLREYLTILMSALEKRQVDFSGEIYSAHTDIRVPAEGRPQVLIAALGPQAVRAAGALADGTLTFMVPLPSLVEMTMPEASKAAREAGRPRPYFAASVPVCVTNDEPRARDDCAATFVNYGSGYYPSYRAALDRAAVGGPRDVGLIGDEDSVAREIEAYRAAGIDELIAVPFGKPEEKARTRAFLGGLSEFSAAKAR
jgi:F420-dependent oxidoreductase-like protein